MSDERPTPPETPEAEVELTWAEMILDGAPPEAVFAAVVILYAKDGDGVFEAGSLGVKGIMLHPNSSAATNTGKVEPSFMVGAKALRDLADQLERYADQAGFVNHGVSGVSKMRRGDA